LIKAIALLYDTYAGKLVSEGANFDKSYKIERQKIKMNVLLE